MNDILFKFIADTTELKPAENALDSLIAKDAELGKEANRTAAIYKQRSSDITASTGKTAKSLQDISTAAKNADKALASGQAKQALQSLEKEVANLKGQLSDYVKKLDELGKKQQETGTQSVSLRGQLRLMREELAKMALAGKQGTAEFIKLQNEAGELDDTLKDVAATISGVGSDTKNIEGVVDIVGGIAGGFAIAQGAAALFGSENEEVNAVLEKTQGILSVLSGIQQFQNLLQKESAANLLLTAGAATTDAVALEGATVATTELNAAMSLNPAGALVAGILALVGVLAYLNTAEDTAVENTQKFQDELVSTSNSVGEAQIKLDVLRQRVFAAGASFTEKQAVLKEYNKEFGDTIGKATSINDLEKILIERAPEYIKMLGLKAKAQAAQNLALKEYEKAVKKQLEASELQDQVNNKSRGSGIADALAGKGTAQRSVDIVLDEAKKAESGIEKLNALAAEAEAAAAEIAKNFKFKTEDDKTEKTKKETGKRKDTAEQEKKDTLARETAALAELKKLRDENYLAQFADETELQRQKVIQETKNEEARIKALDISEDTRRQLLTALRQKEANELFAIDQKLEDARKKLDDERIKDLEAAAKNEIAVANDAGLKNQLDQLEKAHKAKLLSEREYLEAVAKLTGDYSKLEQFNEDHAQALRQKRIATMVGILNDLNASFQQLYGTDAFSTALVQITNFGTKVQNVFEQIKAGTITTAEGIKELTGSAISDINAIITQSAIDQKNQRQTDLQERINLLATARDQELSAENLSAQQRADVKARYDQQEREIKIRAFEADKEAAKRQAEINGAAAIIKTIAVFGFTPAAAFAAAGAAVLTALQIGIINKTQPPRYKRGKPRGQAVPGSGWAIVDDGGKPEPIVRADGSVEFSGQSRDRLTYWIVMTRFTSR